MTLGMKLCLNRFQKNFMQISWIFSCNKFILMRLWVKECVSQEWVQAEITVNSELISKVVGSSDLYF